MNQAIEENETTPVMPRPSRKYPWAILVVVVLFVVIPFISWYGSWFGRPLSDSKVTEYLHDQTKPRNVQHALAQLGNRIIDRDQAVRQFYPDVVAASQHSQAEVRMTAAWVMGETEDQCFVPLLTEMLEREEGPVRANVLRSLSRLRRSARAAEEAEVVMDWGAFALGALVGAGLVGIVFGFLLSRLADRFR